MSTLSNVTWVAESKSRARVIFTGKASGSAKSIINTVKTKLGAFVVKNKVKASEKFKLSIRKNDKTVDAWVVTPAVKTATTTPKKRLATSPTKAARKVRVRTRKKAKVLTRK